MKGKQLLVVTILAISLAVPLLVGCGRGAGESYPSKPIEFVVHAAPGGGSDIFARTALDVIGKNKLVPVTISVVNKPGGSSAVAKAYLAEKAGDPYYWMTTTTSFQTSAVRGQTDLSYKDFTPLAMFAEDTQAILVKDDSRFKDMKQLLDEAKSNPGKVNWGGSSVGNDDHILMYMIQKTTGVQFNYVSFESGGEVMAALLGGHVDMASANPQEAAGQIEANKVRVLAAASDKPIPSLKSVPTLTSMGVNVVAVQPRGLVGPKNMPKEAVQWLEGMFKKMSDTPEWAKYEESNDLIKHFLGADDYAKFLAEDYKHYDEIMTGLGLKKK